MNYEEVLNRIISIALKHFSVEKVEIGPGTTSSEIAAWDSLNHVLFMTNIERSFEIKFDLLQMIDMKSIGDIARATCELLK